MGVREGFSSLTFLTSLTSLIFKVQVGNLLKNKICFLKDIRGNFHQLLLPGHEITICDTSQCPFVDVSR